MNKFFSDKFHKTNKIKKYILVKQKCVIFDMDGVIIDSEPIHLASEKEMFNLLNIVVSDEEHHSFVGASSESLWTKIKDRKKLDYPVDTLVEMNRTMYLKNLKKQYILESVPNVPELIFQLKEEGFLLAVASSSPVSQVSYILDKLQLFPHFNAVITGDEVSKGKPDPEIFLKAAQTVGVGPSSCVVIEDSFNGVTAAINANMKCIGFRNPNSGKQDLSEADLIIHHFNDQLITMINDLLQLEHK